MQHLHNNNQLRKSLIIDSCNESEDQSSSVPVEDHYSFPGGDESLSGLRRASYQKWEGTKDTNINNVFVENIISPATKRREMIEYLVNVLHANVILKRE